MQTPQEFVERYRVSWELVMSGRSTIASMTEYFNVPLSDGRRGGCFVRVFHCRIHPIVQSIPLGRVQSWRSGKGETEGLRRHDAGKSLRPGCGELGALSRRWNPERAWRHYYNLLRKSDGWRIVLSAFQVGS